MIDVGAYGKDSDAEVLAYSAINKCINNDYLAFLSDKLLPNSDLQSPFMVVGGEVFPLRTYLMGPFPYQCFKS